MPEHTIAENLTRLQNAKTAIGNAITTKGGTVATGDGLEEFAADIATIPSGGGISTGKSDVNFYDYDGSVVTSYTAVEFAELSAMPDNPTHEGLTSQGWNWSLSDAKEYVADYGKLNIGQMYKSNTPNGDTLLHIRLSDGRLKPYLGLTGNVSGTAVDIDWDDGSAVESVTLNADTAYTPHEYATAGKYTIAISVTSGTISFNGDSNSYSNIFRKSTTGNSNDDRVYHNILFKAEIGTGVTSIGDSAFNNCYSLTSITIPDTVTAIQSSAFNNCYSLSSITIPDTVTSIGSSAFYYCYSLSSITIPDTVTTIQSNALYGCYSLSSITIPDTVTTIQSSAFNNCYSLSSITIPDTVTTIQSSAFNNCYLLTSITIPDTVTSIGSSAFYYCYSLSSITISNTVTTIQSNSFPYCYSLSSITIPDTVIIIGSNAFYNCYGLGFFKFTRTTPPLVQASSAFANIPTDCIIYVPALVSNLYMNATNYPSKSSYRYIGYATYESGTALPTTTTDETYTLTWYATSADAVAGTNPITQGNGNEVYSVATAI